MSNVAAGAVSPNPARFEIGARVKQSKLGEGIVIRTEINPLTDTQEVAVALDNGDTFTAPARDLELVTTAPAITEPVKVNDSHRPALGKVKAAIKRGETLKDSRRKAFAERGAK